MSLHKSCFLVFWINCIDDIPSFYYLRLSNIISLSLFLYLLLQINIPNICSISQFFNVSGMTRVFSLYLQLQKFTAKIYEFYRVLKIIIKLLLHDYCNCFCSCVCYFYCLLRNVLCYFYCLCSKMF